ncbi:MAG: DUF1761 domain-containing protein [Lewinellaceae bacterium]|nr:DUF1761 domain-containing protein [Lewinellaceae bacterium]
MNFNILVVLATGFIPLILGFLWYNPKTLGNAWMKEADMNEDKMKGANMMMIFGVSLVLGMMLALGLAVAVIHQNHLYSVLMHSGVENPDSEAHKLYMDFMAKYGTEFRTFGHGAMHGFLTSLFVIFPAMGVNALFERKSWKYIFINYGFWAVCSIIMGGIICAWA